MASYNCELVTYKEGQNIHQIIGWIREFPRYPDCVFIHARRLKLGSLKAEDIEGVTDDRLWNYQDQTAIRITDIVERKVLCLSLI